MVYKESEIQNEGTFIAKVSTSAFGREPKECAARANLTGAQVANLRPTNHIKKNPPKS
jgi:hypothetical protein